MKKLILFEVLLIIFFLMTWSVSKAEFNVWGLGMKDCGEMVANYNSGDETLRFGYIQYVAGVITGMMIGTNNTSSTSFFV